MQQVLVLGAGRSCVFLIEYLLEHAALDEFRVVVADADLSMAEDKIGDHPSGKAVQFHIENAEGTRKLIAESTIVISMLPARFHVQVAEICLELRKNLVTASYATDEIRQLDEEARQKGLLILMECGLDPGIDHMSAMKVIDRIRNEEKELTHFETFTGGLLAPETELNNPWQYKFTWNPRNVVMAGQGTVKFKQEGRYKYIPYHRLFRRTEIVEIPGHGFFEGYANRDSLKYEKVYDLGNIHTLYRGTFRRPGFCQAWNVFVQLGATDDTYQMEGVGEMTHRQFINSFLSYNPHDSVELKLAHYLNLDLDSEVMFKIKWLDLFEDEPVGLENGTPAQILEHILKKKWTMNEDDRDMIVMWHKFNYMDGGEAREINSHLVVKGEGGIRTAMAKTVGLPLGIATRLLLQGKIDLKGVQVPIIPEIYDPVLDELETVGVKFFEYYKDAI